MFLTKNCSVSFDSNFILLNMRKFAVLLLFVFPSSIALCQHYDIGFHGGVFSPMDFWYYVDGSVGTTAGIQFHYHFDNKVSISSNYQWGNFGFSPAAAEERINGQRIGTEYASVDVHLLSFMIHRKFRLADGFELRAGTGIGYFLEHWEGEKAWQIGTKKYKRDFTMPIQVSVVKHVHERILVGLKSGVFITPFYIFGGLHVGPEISFRF
ncbi:MAG: hypothetical protein ACXIUQ_13845 [Cecembia sp.]